MIKCWLLVNINTINNIPVFCLQIKKKIQNISKLFIKSNEIQEKKGKNNKV